MAAADLSVLGSLMISIFISFFSFRALYFLLSRSGIVTLSVMVSIAGCKWDISVEYLQMNKIQLLQHMYMHTIQEYYALIRYIMGRNFITIWQSSTYQRTSTTVKHSLAIKYYYLLNSCHKHLWKMTFWFIECHVDSWNMIIYDWITLWL